MDTIANLLTIIRNGYVAKKETVRAPFSNFSQNILNVLVRENFIEGFEVKDVGKFKQFEIKLKYSNEKPALTGIVKISKPGRRIYRGSSKIPKSLSGLGVTIVSTPKGVMTDRQAAKKKLGGEVICQVW